MIDLANLRGGPDNITVVVGEVFGDDLVDPSKSPPVALGLTGSYPTAFGITAAICALTGIVLALLQQYPLGLIAGGAALVAGISGWIKMQLGQPAAPTRGQLGKGPHRRYQVKPNAEFCHQLHSVVQELQEWSRGREQSASMAAIKTRIQEGNQCIEAKDYRGSITRFIQVITTMMKDIKKRPEVDDESIDY
jgi:protein phosphatase